MKRTARDPVRAGLLQRDIVLHDTDNVRLAAQIVDESLRETHFWPGAAIQLIEDSSRFGFSGRCKAPRNFRVSNLPRSLALGVRMRHHRAEAKLVFGRGHK